MEQNDKELLINSSEEYLFEVKTTNFKIILNKLVDTLENLDTDDENYENDMYNIIIIGEELIKQFDFIQKRMLDYHDKKSPTNIRNMEKKIEKLTKEIDENQNILNEIINKEKEKYIILTKENNENKVKVDHCNKIIHELETLLNNQGCEIMKLHNEINNTNENNILEDNILINDIYNKSPEYLSKLNEGNIKVIKQKNEKIKKLQFELNDMYKKINNQNENNNELKNKIQNLEENYTKHLSQLNNVKENEVNTIINKYNEEINFLNVHIHSLEHENYNLKLHKDINNDDIKKPLLERNETLTFFEQPGSEKQTCNFCNIL
jgi:hypothetical protein